MRKEYDFSSGVRGKYARRYMKKETGIHPTYRDFRPEKDAYVFLARGELFDEFLDSVYGRSKKLNYDEVVLAAKFWNTALNVVESELNKNCNLEPDHTHLILKADLSKMKAFVYKKVRRKNAKSR